MKHELFLELFCEEIPARMLENGAQAFKTNFESLLQAAHINFDNVTAYFTPRRLILHVNEVAATTLAQTIEKKGPKLEAGEQVINAFLKANNKTLADLIVKDTNKGKAYFLEEHTPPQNTKDLLKDLIAQAISNIPWPKSMRWGNIGFRFVRPILQVFCCYQNQPLTGHLVFEGECRIPLHDRVFGHRFLAPQPIEVTNFAAYQTKLAESFVIIDKHTRIETIKKEASALANKAGLTLIEDESLFNELACLTENPVALMGTIPSTYMVLPKEVLITSLKVHQRYLCLETKEGTLAPHFIVIANIPSTDHHMIKGYEKVLNARLSDALFFWQHDQREPLSHKVAQLNAITFHEKLGTMGDKVTRLQHLGAHLCHILYPDSVPHAVRAATLAKADLTTDMVGEFPELQGIIGGYYTAPHIAAHPEDKAISEAIREQYLPKSPTDQCPKTPLGIILALSDKLDHLYWMFAIGEKPTGSRDPFALRRQAISIIRLMLEHQLNLSLETLLDSIAKGPQPVTPPITLKAELIGFIFERLHIYLKEQGFNHDIIQAVLQHKQALPLWHYLARIEYLSQNVKQQPLQDLIQIHIRAHNLLESVNKKTNITPDTNIDTRLFVEPAEPVLYQTLQALPAPDIQTQEDYERAITNCYALIAPAQTFFDTVLVQADDKNITQNRCNLLYFLLSHMEHITEFYKIKIAGD